MPKIGELLLKDQLLEFVRLEQLRGLDCGEFVDVERVEAVAPLVLVFKGLPVQEASALQSHLLDVLPVKFFLDDLGQWCVILGQSSKVVNLQLSIGLYLV